MDGTKETPEGKTGSHGISFSSSTDLVERSVFRARTAAEVYNLLPFGERLRLFRGVRLQLKPGRRIIHSVSGSLERLAAGRYAELPVYFKEILEKNLEISANNCWRFAPSLSMGIDPEQFRRT